MTSQLLTSSSVAALKVPGPEKESKSSAMDTDGCCTTAAPSPALTFATDLSWTRQSTEVPALDLESVAGLTDSASDDGPRLALSGQEGDGDVSEAEVEHAYQRIGRVARRLAQERPVVAAADDDDDEPEEDCMRIRLAARRLALGRQEDDDGEVSDAEMEAAATRMGRFARRYALTVRKSC